MTKRHWIYIGSSHCGDRDPRRNDPPQWHWSHDADSYGEEGRALCGQIFPGSPYVSAEPPAEGQHLCHGCKAAIKAIYEEAGSKIDLAGKLVEIFRQVRQYLP